jgi:malate permease and related proteins
MTATALATTILTFVAIVGVGALLRGTKILRAEDARPINALIIYVGLPAFIFTAVHDATLRPDLWGVVAVAWLVFAAMLLLGWLGARLLKLPPEMAGGFIIATALGNTGYIGYPITAALLGDKNLPEAIFYDVFGTVGALVLVGLLVAQHYGTNEEARVNPLRELVTFPAVIALAIALLLRPFDVPVLVSNGLGLLANMVAPLIMLSVGLSLKLRTLGRAARPLLALSALRLLVAPAIALGVGTLILGSAGGGMPLRVAVLEAGMPAMMLTFVVGERFGLDTDFIASAIFVTTAAAAITLPLVQLLAFR